MKQFNCNTKCLYRITLNYTLTCVRLVIMTSQKFQANSRSIRFVMASDFVNHTRTRSPVLIGFQRSYHAAANSLPDEQKYLIKSSQTNQSLVLFPCQDKINEHLDFDYSEFSEIEFDAAILHDLKAKIYEYLIQTWSDKAFNGNF